MMNHCRHAVIAAIDLFHRSIFIFNFIFRRKVIFRYPIHNLMVLRIVVLLRVTMKKVGKLKNKRNRFVSYPVRPVLWYSKTVCHGPKLIFNTLHGQFQKRSKHEQYGWMKKGNENDLLNGVWMFRLRGEQWVNMNIVRVGR
jgi:hypothetical protein